MHPIYILYPIFLTSSTQAHIPLYYVCPPTHMYIPTRTALRPPLTHTNVIINCNNRSSDAGAGASVAVNGDCSQPQIQHTNVIMCAGRSGCVSVCASSKHLYKMPPPTRIHRHIWRPFQHYGSQPQTPPLTLAPPLLLPAHAHYAPLSHKYTHSHTHTQTESPHLDLLATQSIPPLTHTHTHKTMYKMALMA